MRRGDECKLNPPDCKAWAGSHHMSVPYNSEAVTRNTTGCCVSRWRRCFSVSVFTFSSLEILYLAVSILLISLSKPFFISVTAFLTGAFLFDTFLECPSLHLHYPSFLACCLLFTLKPISYLLFNCCWVFVALRALLLWWPLLLQSTGYRCTGFSSCSAWAQQLRLQVSKACGLSSCGTRA